MKEHLREYLNNDSIEAAPEMEDLLLDNSLSEEVDMILKELWNRDVSSVQGVDKTALLDKILNESTNKPTKHALQSKRTTRYSLHKFRRVSIYMAASILLGIVLTTFWLNRDRNPLPQMASTSIEIGNSEEIVQDTIEVIKKRKRNKVRPLKPEPVEINVPEGEVMELNFRDGSVATVEGGSNIAYDQNFTGESRLVALDGRAHFSVVKTEKPFLVNNSKLNLRVVGTEFYVDNRTNRDLINIRVDKGEVWIQTPKGTEISICAGEELMILSRIPKEN